MNENFEYCATLVREVDRDRYLSALFAPPDRREGLLALYAFDAEVTRIRDLAREPMPGEIRLQWWREVLEGDRAAEASANPVSAALLAALARHGLAPATLVGLVEAHRFDIYDEPMPTLAAFRSYALNTAGVIFDCAIVILGDTENQRAAAEEAAQARTIANVIALLPRHAARRQLFVPLDMLQQYGGRAEDVFGMQPTSGLLMVLAELRLRARHHLTHVAQSAGISEKTWPAFLSLAPLWPWLAAMEGRYQPFQPDSLSLLRRQWRIWRAAKSLDRIGC